MRLLDAFLLESEAKIKLIDQRQGDKVLEKLSKEKTKFTSSINFIRFIDNINEKYTQWVVNLYINGKITYNDIIYALEYNFKQFDKVKSFLPQKDINQYKSYDEFVNEINKIDDDVLMSSKSKRQQEKEEKEMIFSKHEADILYQDDSIKVIIPKTEKASCYFGRGTKWCTSGDKGNKFDFYMKGGSIYIFIVNGHKYQLFVPHSIFGDYSDEFSDAMDKSISNQLNNPQIKKDIFDNKQIHKIINDIGIKHKNDEIINDYGDRSLIKRSKK